MRGERLIPFPAPATDAPNIGAVRLLLVSGLVAVAPHTLDLPLGAIAVFVAAVVWRFLTTGWSMYRPGRWLRLVAALATVWLTYRYYGTLLGRDPGVTLLVCLTGLKLLELANLRDYVLSAFLLFVIILGTFLYTQSLAIGIYAFLAVGVNLAALLRLSRAATLPLAHTVRLTAVLIIQALPVMLVLYLLFPRLSGALWGVQLSAPGGLTGMSEIMQPGSVQSLSESTETAFRVNFEGAPPAAALLYWRGRVLWDTDGRAWYPGPPLSRFEQFSFTPLGPPLAYHVTLEPQTNPWLYALDLPGAIPPSARMRAGYVLDRTENIEERYRYDMISYPHYATGRLTPTERERALGLPRSVSARVSALSARWRAQGDDAGVVDAALAYFRNEPFVYTLTPARLGADPVDEFLFETRRGFCEHYAAAFVTLMRAAGVPSRIVVGYQGGELNPTGNYMIVRQADAHAWAEVWLPGRGWVRVDPTAAVAPERIQLGSEAIRRLRQRGAGDRLGADAIRRAMELGWLQYTWARTRLMWDYANFSWYRWVTGYDLERQDQLLARAGIKPYVLPLMVLGVALLVLGYAWLQLPRSRNDAVVATYARFCARLTRAGLSRAPAEGPLAFAQRASDVRPDLAAAINEITASYTTLRYGPMRSPDDVAALKRRVRRFHPRRAA